MKEPRSCGFLIVKGDPIQSFLLMKHANRWDLPKGHVDPGETDLECALRELEEETGIRLDQIQVIDDFLHETRYMVNGKRYGLGKGPVEKTMRIYLGRLTEDVDITLTEHLGFEWFDWQPPHHIQAKAIDPLLEHCAAVFSQPTQAHETFPVDGSQS
ncbi:MAG: NUDIX domain-containing protein [Fuerstiella sp.]|jgi:8-oxo-dGTP pyrophosphatase MutT (NUDIX family)|nr:NUDIX domain-containing protein [Fuerstiella sp.]MCP4507294.1 NUDIX domain-containing protein [Fuerstiella sp.]MDG2131269.1 NUDIX domain-containing protein [Fuerstiella sp.]